MADIVPIYLILGHLVPILVWIVMAGALVSIAVSLRNNKKKEK